MFEIWVLLRRLVGIVSISQILVASVNFSAMQSERFKEELNCAASALMSSAFGDCVVMIGKTKDLYGWI